MKFLKTNHPLLKQISKKIPVSEINSLETKELLKKMFSIAYGERNDQKKAVMVGLAAPQIGISKKIILVAVGAEVRRKGKKRKIGNLKAYINPKIVWSSKEKGEWYEGCYSIPRVCGIISRSLSIKIEGFDIDGKKVSEKHTGFTARIFQHEIDHLNGKFFINRIKNPNNIHRVLPSEFKLYRDKEAWRTWPKKFSYPLASRASK